MELLHGSPADMTGRSDREIRAYTFLDRLGVSFDRTDHPDQPATTMEVCATVDAILGVHICKNLFLCNRQRTAFYLLMMPGDKKFKTKELSAQIHSARLSFGNPEEMLQYLDIEPGAVSIMGLMNDHGHAVKLLLHSTTRPRTTSLAKSLVWVRTATRWLCTRTRLRAT